MPEMPSSIAGDQPSYRSRSRHPAALLILGEDEDLLGTDMEPELALAPALKSTTYIS
jgi:hypothetical protein